MNQPITFCAIVRDEEALLPNCLASLDGAVDRMVIVDTGSTDRTREVAARAGALVVEHPWNDDFAAARNAALAHVDSGFVLALDADERLAVGAAKVLRRAVRDKHLDCGMLPLHNATALDASANDVLSGKSRRGEPVLLPRLLRRTDDLRWEGIVHENVNAWVTRGKRRVVRVDAAIVHYGMVPDLREARDKDARNFRLLERRVELAPHDAIARAYLARECERIGDSERALREADRAWTDLVDARRRGEDLDVVALATLRAFLLVRAKRLDEARETLAVARSVAPDHPNLNLLGGVVEETVALAARDSAELDRALERATKSYEACLSARGAISWCETMPGATDWAAATRLGTVRLLQGDALRARKSFEQALARNPQHAEAVLGAIEADVLGGRAEPALAALEPLLADTSPDAWILASFAAARLGLHNDAATFAMEATRRAESREPIAVHRGRLLAELRRMLYESTPAALPSSANTPGSVNTSDIRS